MRVPPEMTQVPPVTTPRLSAVVFAVSEPMRRRSKMRIRSITLAATVAAVAAWPGLVSTEAASQERQTITSAFRTAAIPSDCSVTLAGLPSPPACALPTRSCLAEVTAARW
jgi:hypothetical protein